HFGTVAVGRADELERRTRRAERTDVEAHLALARRPRKRGVARARTLEQRRVRRAPHDPSARYPRAGSDGLTVQAGTRFRLAHHDRRKADDLPGLSRRRSECEPIRRPNRLGELEDQLATLMSHHRAEEHAA